MSPLLGAVGDASEYAYRGTLDDVPDDFNFTNIFDVEPGIAVTTGPVTITGLNNKVQVTVSAGASIAVNSGIFTSGPTFIRSGDNIALYTPTTQGTDTDFSKTYTITATVGQTSKDWIVITRDKDSLPDAFSFTNSIDQELGITTTSNTITLSGLDSTVPSNAAITSGIGSFSKNGGAPGTASTVGNGDTLAVVLKAPTDYSQTNTTTITVGTLSTDFSVTTRDADTTVDQFSFTNFTNVAISSSFDSNSIILSGADPNTEDAPVPLTATVTGGFLKVDRGAIPIRDFSIDPATVFNGDTLTLKINSSPNYSTTVGATLSITGANTPVGVSSTFTVSTRPNISDTIVDNFQFVDKSNQDRNILVISDPITISGITTGADDFASIFLSNNADGGEFRITRNGEVVRDFGISTSGVRQGDLVDLRIRTSPASEGTVLTNVNIAGTDNNDINNVFSQTRTDTWVVKSAKRNCPLSLPTFDEVTGVEPSTVQSVTFTPTSYDSDCNVIINTSNPNSTVSVGGTTGNNLLVLPGVACTVSLTAGPFNGSRSTTITLTANNNVPTPVSTASTFTVTTRKSIDPTVNIFASSTFITCGGQAIITYSTTNAVSIRTEGFAGIGTQNLNGVLVSPKRTTTYAVIATGPDGTTARAPVTINVQSPVQAFLQASGTFIPFNGSVTLAWSTTGASFVTSNFGASAPSGQITLNNLKQTTTYTLTAVSNSGCDNVNAQPVTVQVAPCTEETEVDTSYGPGINLNYTLAQNGNFYFTSIDGFNINSQARSTSGGGTQSFSSGPTLGTYLAGTCPRDQSNSCVQQVDFDRGGSQVWVVPDGVNFINVEALGAGGGGGGGGNDAGGGRGGQGGRSVGSVNVSPGQQVRFDVGSGGGGAPRCRNGNIFQGGVAGGPGGTTFAIFPNGQFVFATGGGGGSYGGLNNVGQSFAGDDGFGQPNGGLNRNSGGFGGTGGQIANQCIGSDGANGAPGRLLITYQQSITSDTWATLVNSINSTFRSRKGRPPTVNEMDTYIGQYISSSIDLNSLLNQIPGGFTGSVLSLCGSPL